MSRCSRRTQALCIRYALDTVLGYIRVATRFEGNVTAKIGL